MPIADEVKEKAFSVLKNEKGSGYAGHLIELCDVSELPKTLVAFMQEVYGRFTKPEPVPPLVEAPSADTPTAPDTGGMADTEDSSPAEE
jgi:putative ATP-dependent endonuclease of OLD family